MPKSQACFRKKNKTCTLSRSFFYRHIYKYTCHVQKKPIKNQLVIRVARDVYQCFASFIIIIACNVKCRNFTNFIIISTTKTHPKYLKFCVQVFHWPTICQVFFFFLEIFRFELMWLLVCRLFCCGSQGN